MKYVLQFENGEFYRSGTAGSCSDPCEAGKYNHVDASKAQRLFRDIYGTVVKVLAEEEAVHWFRLGNNRTSDDDSLELDLVVESETIVAKSRFLKKWDFV